MIDLRIGAQRQIAEGAEITPSPRDRQIDVDGRISSRSRKRVGRRDPLTAAIGIQVHGAGADAERRACIAGRELE